MRHGCRDVHVVNPARGWSCDVVQCNASSEAWFLTCRGTTWVGHVGNCTGSTVAYHTGALYAYCSCVAVRQSGMSDTGVSW